jgi:hypothetical protein
VNDKAPSITAAISRDDAFEFLRQLAEDDELRARVEADPGAELAARGIAVSPELLPKRARLASKDQISEYLILLGDDPADKFGRPKGEAWFIHLLYIVFMFGALPFVQRGTQDDGAP